MEDGRGRSIPEARRMASQPMRYFLMVRNIPRTQRSIVIPRPLHYWEEMACCSSSHSCLRTKSCCSKISKDADAAIAFDNGGMNWRRGSSSLVPFASPGTFASPSPPRFTKPCVVRLRNRIPIKPLVCSSAVATSNTSWVLEIALPVVLVQGLDIRHTKT